MTDDQHGDRHREGAPGSGGRWDPLPQGDYDDGATAFVQLPEGGIDAMLSGADSPLAAPGHGYVPPPITVAPATTAGTDPAATGTWSVPGAGAPVDGARWNSPGAQNSGQTDQGGQGGASSASGQGGQDGYGYDPGATGQWSYGDPNTPESSPEGGAPGQDASGPWSIPVANDIPDESGEFTRSSLVEQWGGNPPATLPGGAPAPWANTQSIGRPWGPGVPGVPQDDHDTPRDRGPEHPGAARQGEDQRHPAGGHTHAEAPPAQDGTGRGHDGHPAQGAPDGQGGLPDDRAQDGNAETQQLRALRQHTAGSYPAPSGEPHWRPGERQEPGAEAAGRGASREHPQNDARPGDGPGEPGVSDEPAHQGREQDAGQDDRPQARNEEGDRPADGEETDAAAPEGRPSHEQVADAGSRPQDKDGTGGESSSDDGAPSAQDQLPAPVYDDHPLASYVLRVNGTDRPVADAWIGESLLYVLRERLGLAGAKDGCSQGECGACNVQVDGRLVASCLVPAVTAAGSEVRTVEGLAQDGQPSDVQRALARCGAVQCGFCVPGMAMTVHDLLEGNPAPTDLETRQALCGNLCRCSGYRGVVDAVKQVVAEREALAASTAPETETPAEADEPRIPHQAGPGAGGVDPSAFQPSNDQPYGQDGGQA